MRFLILAALLVTASAGAELDFELSTLDGGSERLSDYRGQWVVVNYWATWCKPCRKEIPDLSELHDARADLTVLGLAFEDTEPADFERFLAAHPASYPILVVDVYEPPADLGAPRVLPTTHLIDARGELLETWLGPVTSEMIESRIESLQEQSPEEEAREEQSREEP